MKLKIRLNITFSNIFESCALLGSNWAVMRMQSCLLRVSALYAPTFLGDVIIVLSLSYLSFKKYLKKLCLKEFLISYLTTTCSLTPYQFGFQPKRYTTQVLLCAIHNIIWYKGTTLDWIRDYLNN